MPDEKVQTPFPLTEIAQVCLIVKDLEKTVENFYHIFGVGPWSFYTYGKPLVKKMTKGGKPADYKMRVALSNIGTLRIELIQVLGGDTIYQEFIDEHGYGVHHFGLLVDNMQDALQCAENAGFVMTQDGAGFGLDGDGHYAYLNTEDKIDVTLELIERPKRRQKPEKIYPPQKEL